MQPGANAFMKFLDTLKALPPSRQLILAAAVAGIIAAMTFLIQGATREPMTLLYSGLEPVHAGEIGNWAKADHFMVVSNQAGFVGNDPGSEVEAKGRHHRIAFLGQVPVKVHGTVSPGDYVIASERNDGTGIAKAAADIGVNEMSRVVGRAWEGSAEEGLKTVNTAVGLDQTSLVVPTLQRLERENKELRERLQKLEERLAEPSRMVSVRNQ